MSKAAVAAAIAKPIAPAVEWVAHTPQTHLAWISGFPYQKADFGLNPSILLDAVRELDHKETKKLLMGDGNVNTCNPNGSSITHIAVRSGDYSMLELVMSFHPNVEVKEHNTIGGMTPMHLASSIGNARMVKLLLKNKADPASQDAYWSTPLHIAARLGHMEVVESLLEVVPVVPKHSGIMTFPEMRDKQGKSPYYWAKEMGHDKIADLLPVIPYDSLVQLDLAHAANKAWDPNPKKKAGGKKDKKDKKDEKKKKK